MILHTNTLWQILRNLGRFVDLRLFLIPVFYTRLKVPVFYTTIPGTTFVLLNLGYDFSSVDMHSIKYSKSFITYNSRMSSNFGKQLWETI